MNVSSSQGAKGKALNAVWVVTEAFRPKILVRKAIVGGDNCNVGATCSPRSLTPQPIRVAIFIALRCSQKTLCVSRTLISERVHQPLLVKGFCVYGAFTCYKASLSL